MGDAAFPARFSAAGRPGAFLRILAEGDLAAGDPVSVVYRPEHGLTVGDVARIYRDRAQADLLLHVPELAENWRAWARKRVA
jgi:MOSC domain-containing protein YiiM